MSFDEFALICTYSGINVLSQVKSGLSFFWIFLMKHIYPERRLRRLCNHGMNKIANLRTLACTFCQSSFHTNTLEDKYTEDFQLQHGELPLRSHLRQICGQQHCTNLFSKLALVLM